MNAGLTRRAPVLVPALASVMLLAILVAPAVWSTTLLHVDLERMSREAPMVVHGFVAWDYAVQKGAVGDIYSYTGIEVTDCVKGQCPETVVLKHRGGTVGDLTLHIPGMPRFVPAQEVLLFLRPEPEGEEGMMSVFAMAQGFFLVKTDKKTGVKNAVQQLGSVTLAAPDAGGAIVPVGNVGPIVGELSSLKARIKTLATKKDGGAQ